MDEISLPIDFQGSCDWAPLRPYSNGARRIITEFSKWAECEEAQLSLVALRQAFPKIWEESTHVADIAGVDPMAVLAANVYYDLSMKYPACTAFAVNSPNGPIHAHCLDWDSGFNVLREHSHLFRYTSQDESTKFLSVGWPGFLGVFVGIAPSRFAVTLNAVWSKDEGSLSEPVAFLLRKALTAIQKFDDAVMFLAEAKISCNCLLLITGVHQGEIAVIERTPLRSIVCRTDRKFHLITNHYCLLEAGSNKPGYIPTGQEPVGRNSHGRYKEASKRLSFEIPRSMKACFSLLASPPFCQPTTVQHVAMRASTGEIIASPTVEKLN